MLLTDQNKIKALKKKKAKYLSQNPSLSINQFKRWLSIHNIFNNRNQELNPEAAKRELNMLAALIKGSDKQDDKETLDINLFPEPIKKY